jgi:hypothetical protein
MEFSWHAPEFKYHYKDSSWYWTSGIVAGILFLISLFQKNYLLAIFLVLAEFTVLIWAKRLPKTIEFKINEKGVNFGHYKFYPYEDLAGFHIKHDNEEIGELVLKTHSKITPFVKIHIFLKDSSDIRDILKKYLDEVEYEESFMDSISDLLGF